MASILVLYGTFEGHAGKIAERIAAVARASGYESDVIDGKALPAEFSPLLYNAAIVGASVHMGQHVDSVTRFVKTHRAWLNQTSSAFYSVSLVRSGQLAQHRAQAEEYVRAFLNETDWHPCLVATFGGALPFTRYGFTQRFITNALARRTLGRIDTSRDAVYTDWDEVAKFAEEFLATLP